MTHTDQAFIRAYGQQQSVTLPPASGSVRQPPRTPPVHWVSTDVDVAAYMPAELESQFNKYGTDPSNSSAAETPIPGLQSRVSPGRHRPQRFDRAANSPRKRPLASFIRPDSSQDRFQPGTIVATFRLPSICRHLLEQQAAQYDAVIDAILASAHEGRTLIGIAGCQAQDGCTTTLICLAAQLAALGKSVVMLDANLKHPELATRLGIAPGVTWHDVLSHGVPVAEAVVQSAVDGLCLLPAANPVDGAIDSVGGLHASAIAGALRYACDITLLDLGALLQPDHDEPALQLAVAMRIDAAIAVTTAVDGYDDGPVQLQQLLGPYGCGLLGTIENFIDA